MTSVHAAVVAIEKVHPESYKYNRSIDSLNLAGLRHGPQPWSHNFYALGMEYEEQSWHYRALPFSGLHVSATSRVWPPCGHLAWQ